jgi:hypothetical protein
MTSSMPPAGPGPEYLEQGGGAPLTREPRSGGGGRKAFLAATIVVGLAAVGGAVWAATSFFASGPQPAEALPASTIGYASIDLDPSGGQKIEAFRMLNKFPAFEDKIGLDADDDIKRAIFDRAEVSEACEGLDYAGDVEPWLGDRAAIAAVDLGKAQPTPAAVVQVTDGDAAADGLAKIRECAGGDTGAWSITGEWAVLAETQSLAEEIEGETAKATLADDETFQKWTGEVGDAGVLNLYAAPAAGDYLADNLDSLGFPFGPMMGMSGGAGSAGVGPGNAAYSSELEFEPELPAGMVEGLRDFQGVAATLRFDDGALELESVGDATMTKQSFAATDGGDDVLATLPADTAAAVGVGLQDGWAQRLLDQLAGVLGNGQGPDQLVAQAEQWTGLALPEDLETLFGDSTVLAVGNDVDPQAFANSEVGVKVKGDAQAIEGVLDKVRNRIGEPMSEPLHSRSAGDAVAIGPNDDYLAEIIEDGGLGDSEAFRDVVREADRAGAILFVNFDAGDAWLDAIAEGDQEARDNLEPLKALGISTWQDGDTGHGLVRLTTN